MCVWGGEEETTGDLVQSAYVVGFQTIGHFPYQTPTVMFSVVSSIGLDQLFLFSYLFYSSILKPFVYYSC